MAGVKSVLSVGEFDLPSTDWNTKVARRAEPGEHFYYSCTPAMFIVSYKPPPSDLVITGQANDFEGLRVLPILEEGEYVLSIVFWASEGWRTDFGETASQITNNSSIAMDRKIARVNAEGTWIKTANI